LFDYETLFEISQLVWKVMEILTKRQRLFVYKVIYQCKTVRTRIYGFDSHTFDSL